MSPFEMVAVLDDAIAATRGNRRVALELRAQVPMPQSAPTVRGRYLGADDEGPVYGFTRRQCQRMRVAIFTAAREDVEAREDTEAHG